MPFNPNNPPAKLKNLSAKKQRQWVHVFNSCYKKNPDEKKCHMQAWGTVKKSAASVYNTGMAQGCGCDVMGNCGCEHEHSEVPTAFVTPIDASERIITELRLVMRDLRAANRCQNNG